MWWYGRENSGGSWLPEEEKKANMWHGRGNSGGSWSPAFPRSCSIQLWNKTYILLKPWKEGTHHYFLLICLSCLVVRVVRIANTIVKINCTLLYQLWPILPTKHQERKGKVGPGNSCQVKFSICRQKLKFGRGGGYFT